MPDTPEPGLVDLDLIDPETTADLQLAAARRPDPSHLGEFVDGSDWENGDGDPDDGPTSADKPGPIHDHCPSCGQSVPPIRDLLADTLDRIAPRVGAMVAEARRRAVAARPGLATLFRADADALESKFMRHGGILASLFDPADAEALASLHAYLDSLASADAKVAVPDPDWPGGHRPPSLLDYAVVNHHLVAALRTAHGDSWTPLHTRAWYTALSYAAARMCAAQVLGGAR